MGCLCWWKKLFNVVDMMKEKIYTLAEIKAKHKRAGGFFFEKGLPPVVAKKGNDLITKGFARGFVLYRFYPKTGKIQYVRDAKNKKDF